MLYYMSFSLTQSLYMLYYMSEQLQNPMKKSQKEGKLIRFI